MGRSCGDLNEFISDRISYAKVLRSVSKPILGYSVVQGREGMGWHQYSLDKQV